MPGKTLISPLPPLIWYISGFALFILLYVPLLWLVGIPLLHKLNPTYAALSAHTGFVFVSLLTAWGVVKLTVGQGHFAGWKSLLKVLFTGTGAVFFYLLHFLAWQYQAPAETQLISDVRELPKKSALELREAQIRQTPALEDDIDYGRDLLYGTNGVPLRPDRAKEWILPAAQAGITTAQNLLGILNSGGLGVARNCGQAYYWLRKAARRNYAEAMRNLGKYYLDGQCGKPDYRKAAFWMNKITTDSSFSKQSEETLSTRLRSTAEAGDADAQFILGRVYELGLWGVEADKSQALTWYQHAAEQGHQAARKQVVAPSPPVQAEVAAEASDTAKQNLSTPAGFAATPTDINFYSRGETWNGKRYAIYSVRCSNGIKRKITAWNKRRKWCIGDASRKNCSNVQLKAAKKACGL